MELAKNIILIGASILAGLGVFAFGGGYLLSKWRTGSKEEQAEGRDLISSNDQIKQFYKEQNDDLKNINNALGEKVEALTREVGEIRGQLNAEVRQKEAYLKILENRDPETKKFMELMTNAVKDQQIVNKEIVRILSEIHSMSTDEHNRDFKVTATVTKTESEQ